MARCYENLHIKRVSGNYKKYLNELYVYFKEELLNADLRIKNLPVRFREYPPEGLDKEEAFYHLTCRNYSHKIDHRMPDFNRAERIRIIRAIIDNFLKCEKCILDDSCNGILMWIEPFNNSNRIHLYLQEERYIIVLEKRTGYYLLITAFYVDNEEKHEYYISKYDRYQVSVDDI